ncbi:hypothetical protein SAMN05421505_104278 [Sinosporangium album]|uniref:Uncharacterized protein n=1 Tax=Sinosporangium album TaxID=504805 RepID=A0A1G7UJD3_9ACTN|nr:hypothetical protein [Sinosporangium album]SDG47458.1 hypothetical protein SAMN05421505_104278 [Sinosporangium album]
MQLTQQSTPAPAQDLPGGDNTVITGPMGDCVSVVVLWNPDGNGRYQSVRGYHGSGGFQAINLPSLFNAVPNVVATRIIGFFTTQSLSSNDRQRFQDYCVAHFANAVCTVAQGGGNYRVDRTGAWAVQQ